MPVYVYGCKENEHPRVEVVHSIGDQPDLYCDKCKGKLHRVPQRFSWYGNPFYSLVDLWEGKHVDWRKREERKRKRAEREQAEYRKKTQARHNRIRRSSYGKNATGIRK